MPRRSGYEDSYNNPVLRLDEHDRSCFLCAKNAKRCLRGEKLAQLAIAVEAWANIPAPEGNVASTGEIISVTFHANE